MPTSNALDMHLPCPFFCDAARPFCVVLHTFYTFTKFNRRVSHKRVYCNRKCYFVFYDKFHVDRQTAFMSLFFFLHTMLGKKTQKNPAPALVWVTTCQVKRIQKDLAINAFWLSFKRPNVSPANMLKVNKNKLKWMSLGPFQVTMADKLEFKHSFHTANAASDIEIMHLQSDR